VQPTQLSLLPDQAPAPPLAAVQQLPEPQARAAGLLLARLIVQAADPNATTGEGQEVGDE